MKISKEIENIINREIYYKSIKQCYLTQNQKAPQELEDILILINEIQKMRGLR